MSWNYRIVEDLEGNFFITEVWYTKKGKPHSWIGQEVGICRESLEECKDEFFKMSVAFTKPRLKIVEKNGKQKLVEWR